MRNSIDRSDEHPSRVSRVVVIVSTLGVALIAAWVFAPILLANYTATISNGLKSRGVAQAARVVPPVAATTPAPPVAAPEIEAAAPLPVRAVATTTPSRLDTPAIAPWPADAAPAAPTDTGATYTASVTPQSAAADATEVVPLPRKRPSLAIAARHTIPLPRPRPEAEVDIPADEQSAFERQVDRMR